MRKKFKGPLGQRVEPREIGLLMPADEKMAIARQWIREDWEKILLLCERYDIPPGEHMFVNLTLALARDFVPGFKTKKKTGRKEKWTVGHEHYLLIDIDRYVEENASSVSEAADYLASRDPWKNFLEPRDKIDPMPNPGEVLRRKYTEVNGSKWAAVYRKAYLWTVETQGEDFWKRERDDFFAGNSSGES